MADNTKIEWTDATVNFWWGCTKVGPGCDHCYAEAWDKRTGGAHFGQGVARRKIKSAVKTLHRLDNDYAWWAADLVIRDGEPFRPRNVFIQSMSDLFDNEVPIDWLAEAWQAITACDRVNVQIVTKRLPMVEKRLSAIDAKWPSHAGLIVTVVNQDEADRDVPRLLALKARLGIPWVGLSVEPMLGPVDLRKWIGIGPHIGASTHVGADGIDRCDFTGNTGELDWVICGGESGPGARPMHPDWARSLRDQCVAAGMAFFFKQNGQWLHETASDAEKWDWEDADQRGLLHVWDDGTTSIRLRKADAGRLLDGHTWDETPGVAHG